PCSSICVATSRARAGSNASNNTCPCSTASLVRLSPNPVSSRTTLMTLILRAPQSLTRTDILGANPRADSPSRYPLMPVTTSRDPSPAQSEPADQQLDGAHTVATLTTDADASPSRPP